MKFTYIIRLFILQIIISILYGCNNGSSNVNNLLTTHNITSIKNTSNSSSLSLVSPNRFLYVVNSGTDTISGYYLDLESGSPVAIPSQSDIATGALPTDIAAFSNGNSSFVYVANNSDYSVSEYQLLGDSGVLKSIATIATDNSPSDIKISELGFVYVINSGSNTVSSYKINTDGSLINFPSSGDSKVGNVKTGNNPNDSIIIGSFFYVLNSGDSTISSYTIDPKTGVLTQFAQAFLVDNNVTLSAIQTDPSGKFIYVINSQVSGSVDGSIYMFGIGNDGSLTKLSPNSIGTGSGPTEIAFNNGYAYVGNANYNNIEVYSYSSTSGLLVRLGITESYAYSPFYLISNGKYLYALNSNSDSSGTLSGNITQFTFSVDGSLTSPYSTASSSVMQGVYEMDITQGSTINKYSAITTDSEGNFIILGNYGASFKVTPDLSSFQYFTMNPNFESDFPDLNSISYNQKNSTFIAVGDQKILNGSYDSNKNIVWTEIESPNANLISSSINQITGDTVIVGNGYSNGKSDPSISYALYKKYGDSQFTPIVPGYGSGFTHVAFSKNRFFLGNNDLRAIEFFGYVEDDQLVYIGQIVPNGSFNSINSFYVDSSCDDEKYSLSCFVSSSIVLTDPPSSGGGASIWVSGGQIQLGVNTKFQAVMVTESSANPMAIIVGQSLDGASKNIFYSDKNFAGNQFIDWKPAQVSSAIPLSSYSNLKDIAGNSEVICAVGDMNVICSKDQGQTWDLLSGN